MAKRKEPDLSERLDKAKTFHAALAIRVDNHKRSILRLQRAIKSRRREDIALREHRQTRVRKHESEIRSIEARRERYDKYQANKKIPAALRKRIAELETEILRKEPFHDWRAYVRYRKRDLAELFEQVERINNPPKALSTTNKAFRVGKEYPGVSITRAYDGHVWDVLKGHFEVLPRAKGQRTSFKIVAPLPEKPEYLQLKERHFTKTLEALVDDAYEIVGELQAEMEEAYENTPEGLQGSDVGEARETAAMELGDISGGQPELPECVSTLTLVHYPAVHQTSRGDRADEAANMLRAAIKAIELHRASGVKLKKAEAKDLDEFVEQLEDHASQIQEVEFPGMFG